MIACKQSCRHIATVLTNIAKDLSEQNVLVYEYISKGYND